MFSYLHALYVWYDGENLADRFHIQKNVIKTDEDEELMEPEYEDQLEKKEKLDLAELEYDPESDIIETIKFVEENNGIITTNSLRESTYLQEAQLREAILSSNKDARKSYCEKTGLDESMFNTNAGQTFVSLPDSLFTDSDSYGFEDEEDKVSNPYSHVTGNMANIFIKL